jgi:hypothetical protein
MVKMIDKAIVINLKYIRMREKGLYSSNKENLICSDKRITANL